MSHNELRGTTSRTALIFGMTDSDQIGMQQARAPAAARPPAPAGPETLPDAGDVDPSDGEVGEEVDPATGLSGADLEAFRQMESGEPAPPAGDDDLADPDADDDSADPAGENLDEPAEPEPGAPQPPQPGQRQPPKTVNFSKHQRELKRVKDQAEAFRVQAEKERTDRIKLSERIAIINEALAAQAAAVGQQQPAPGQLGAPDPNALPENPFEEQDIDPAEDYAAAVQQERRRNRYAYEATQQTQTRVQETAEDTQMRETFTRDFANYASTPEGAALPDAYQFLKDQRLRQICLAEFDKDPLDQNEEFTPQEVKTMVDIFNSEEKWLVGNAIKQRKSPAAAIMKQAKIYGFTPKAPPAPAAARGAQPPPRQNGGARPSAAPRAPAAAPSAADQLAELSAAQAAGRSLSDGGGAPPSGVSAELLLNLDDDEFAEMVDSMSKHQLDTIMGRVPT